MNKQTIISIVILGIGLVFFSLGIVNTSKANDDAELIRLQQRNIELEDLIQQEKDNWHVADQAQQECINSCQVSWGKKKDEASKNADTYRLEINQNDNMVGLIKSRKAQK